MQNKTNRKFKIIVDISMTAALLLLMSYGLIGEAAHEWIGMAMFILFVAHHILNRRWIGVLHRGRYTSFRVMQTVLAGLILLCMMGSMISGIILSRHVFAFLPRHGGYEIAGTAHIFCAFWGFVLMSLHLGMHWNMMITMIDRYWRPGRVQRWILRVTGYAIALYGAVAFLQRNVTDYLFLRSHFVFYDYEQPVILFLLDYLAIMGLFILIGQAIAGFMRKSF